MIRKLEHDREKLSSQLERSQESASQAKKIARESEKAVKTERENAARLEVCFWLENKFWARKSFLNKLT